MAILDIFKKRKKEKEITKEAKEGKKPAVVSDVAGKREIEEKKTEKKKEVKEAKFGQSYRILKSPHITEKASDLAEKNQYTFRIFPRTNKIEVKKTIEDTYGVDVVSIKIINVHEKKRRLGKIQGTRPGYKKAIVRIKKGQKIEVLPR